MINSPIYYVDFSKSGIDYTGLRDIAMITNEQAVLESVYNILYTEPGDLPMRPEFGCSLNQFLFEPIDPITSVSIKQTIQDAIENQEPRVLNLSVQVYPNADMNTYIINVYFNISVVQSTLTISIPLTQIR